MHCIFPEEILSHLNMFRMCQYIQSKSFMEEYPHLDFLGAFTTIVVTNRVSDVLHTDREYVGLTWIIPLKKYEGEDLCILLREYEGGDLCIPQYGMRIPLKPGNVIAFHTNILRHHSSKLLIRNRLALTCFTDRNIKRDSMNYVPKSN